MVLAHGRIARVFGTFIAVALAGCAPTQPGRDPDSRSFPTPRPNDRLGHFADTYVEAMLADLGLNRVVRWHVTQGETRVLTVWVAPDGPIGAARWLRLATREWHAALPEILFELTGDSTRADVTIAWKRALGFEQWGDTRVAWHEPYLALAGASIILATHLPDGRELSRSQMRSAVTHELGHALGLGHSPHPRDVMFRRSVRFELTGADVRTIQAFYATPIGPL